MKVTLVLLSWSIVAGEPRLKTYEFNTRAECVAASKKVITRTQRVLFNSCVGGKK